jgi:hypothetical protein
MIARDVEIVDLAPSAWRNLLSLMDLTRINDARPDRPNVLSVLHHGGKVSRVYAPAGYRVPTLEQIDDPQELAKKLYYQLPGLERVQILEIQSLALFSEQVQRLDWQSFDMEDFFFRAYHLAEQDPAGLCFFPPFSWSWNGIPLEDIRKWLAAGPSPSAYFLGVLRDSLPWTTLILRVEDGKVRLITTLQHLAGDNLPVDRWPTTAQDLPAICEAVSARVAPVRAALVCDYLVLARLLASEDKGRDLAAAVADGSAAQVGLLE